jgi:hypothetical protein
VLAPPPLDDGFAAYYNQVQAEIKKKDPKHSADVCKRFSELQPKPAKDDDDTPKENDKIGIVEINPDLVAQIDQKLLSQILKLITEKGARARYVKEARRSGVRLLRMLLATAAETTTSFGADPRLVRNLRRLRELKDRASLRYHRSSLIRSGTRLNAPTSPCRPTTGIRRLKCKVICSVW